jgi:hypothetical protein
VSARIFVTHVSGIDDFDDVGVSLFSAFNMLVLGVFQLDTVSAWWHFGRIPVFQFFLTMLSEQFTKCGQNQVVSRLLFLFSMVFIPIILLNLLIGESFFIHFMFIYQWSNSLSSAIMSFNFHQVKTHEQSELFRLRARIILDIETFMSDEERSDLSLFPKYFQILQRKMSKAAESEGNLSSVLL